MNGNLKDERIKVCFQSGDLHTILESLIDLAEEKFQYEQPNSADTILLSNFLVDLIISAENESLREKSAECLHCWSWFPVDDIDKLNYDNLLIYLDKGLNFGVKVEILNIIYPCGTENRFYISIVELKNRADNDLAIAIQDIYKF